MLKTEGNTYLKKYEQLSKRFLKETKQDSKQSLVVFTNWLVAQKAKWSPLTWRLYKNASIYLLRQNEIKIQARRFNY